MDLEAAKLNETRTSSLARLSMAACFAAASVMLLTSLNVAQNSDDAFARDGLHQDTLPRLKR